MVGFSLGIASSQNPLSVVIEKVFFDNFKGISVLAHTLSWQVASKCIKQSFASRRANLIPAKV
jgi:hypothetical protein